MSFRPHHVLRPLDPTLDIFSNFVKENCIQLSVPGPSNLFRYLSSYSSSQLFTALSYDEFTNQQQNYKKKYLQNEYYWNDDLS